MAPKESVIHVCIISRSRCTDPTPSMTTQSGSWIPPNLPKPASTRQVTPVRKNWRTHKPGKHPGLRSLQNAPALCTVTHQTKDVLLRGMLLDAECQQAVFNRLNSPRSAFTLAATLLTCSIHMLCELCCEVHATLPSHAQRYNTHHRTHD